jgi:hypothetical protein
MRRLLALLLAAGVGVSSCSPPAAPRPAPRATKDAVAAGRERRVVVAIVVDQLAAWVIDERLGVLPKDGGFARLAREGTRARDMRYAHAVTDTAPGHAALHTGAVPRASGIFGNETIDASGKKVSVLLDPATALVGAAGPIAGTPSSSAAILRADTIADRLRDSRPDARIVSVSLKDRGAIFGGGRAPSASVWYDKGRGAWVTSTAFAQALPAWARASPIAPLPAQWTLLDPEWTRAHAATPDDQPGEGDYGGMGIVFPHPLGAAREPKLAFRATPFADEALLAMALAALDDAPPLENPSPRAPTLLAVSLSANDYVGHTFGPDSWEAWDELRRLDAALARFFAALDARLGADGWAALLSADHGTVRMPEAMKDGCTRAPPARKDRWGHPCEPGVRILPDALAKLLQREAEKTAGDGHWVEGVVDPYVYLGAEARFDAFRSEWGGLPRVAPRAGLVETVRTALGAVPGVQSIYHTGEFAARESCPPDSDESESALVCRSIPPNSGAGDLYVVTKPGSFFDPDVVVGKGTSHGSPWLFDRSVPLFVRAPGRVRAGAVLDEPVGFGAFARTASSLLGIDPPAAAKGARDLTEP